MADDGIHMGHEGTDALTAWLMAFHPGNLVPTDAAWRDSPLAHKLPVSQAPAPLQGLYLRQHLAIFCFSIQIVKLFVLAL